jgi:ATP-dependent RNA helicase RhlE
VRGLLRAGMPAQAIHGNKSQGQRQRVLEAFRNGEVRTLVATDIAARGIDVDGISHVVNFDLPNVPETYVHRIGRTARAGAEGVAISLCDGEELAFLRDIEKLIRMSIPGSDKRTHPRRDERATAQRTSARSAVDAAGKTRHRQRGNAAGKQGDRDQARERGIKAVAFLHRNVSSRRDAPQRAPRWTSDSKGL